MDHRNLIKPIEYFEDNDKMQLIIIMEYFQGTNLEDLIAEISFSN